MVIQQSHHCKQQFSASTVSRVFYLHSADLSFILGENNW